MPPFPAVSGSTAILSARIKLDWDVVAEDSHFARIKRPLVAGSIHLSSSSPFAKKINNPRNSQRKHYLSNQLFRTYTYAFHTHSQCLLPNQLTPTLRVPTLFTRTTLLGLPKNLLDLFLAINPFSHLTSPDTSSSRRLSPLESPFWASDEEAERERDSPPLPFAFFALPPFSFTR